MNYGIISTCEKFLLLKIITPKLVAKEMKQREEKQKFTSQNLVVGDSVIMQVKYQWKPAKAIAISQNAPHSRYPNPRRSNLL